MATTSVAAHDGEAGMLFRLGALEFGAQFGFDADQDQGGVGRLFKKGKCCRNRHGATVITAHAVDS